MQEFQQLGADGERLWHEKNYSEELFSALSARALTGYVTPATEDVGRKLAAKAEKLRQSTIFQPLLKQ